MARAHHRYARIVARPGAAVGEAGVHALIIGISSYPYMSGGTDAATVQNNYAIGQLLASAKTAAQVFDWVLRHDVIAGQPVLSCRVLLSPQVGAETSAVQALTRGHYGTPSFDQLAAAIKAWSKEFLLVDPARAKQNVSLFFFSGHGFEHLSSPSRVPLDFLAGPGQAGLQNLIAITGVRDALKTYRDTMPQDTRAVAEIARFTLGVTIPHPSGTRPARQRCQALIEPVSIIVIERAPCCDRMKAHHSPMSVSGSRKVLLHLVDVG